MSPNPARQRTWPSFGTRQSAGRPHWTVDVQSDPRHDVGRWARPRTSPLTSRRPSTPTGSTRSSSPRRPTDRHRRVATAKVSLAEPSVKHEGGCGLDLQLEVGADRCPSGPGVRAHQIRKVVDHQQAAASELGMRRPGDVRPTGRSSSRRPGPRTPNDSLRSTCAAHLSRRRDAGCSRLARRPRASHPRFVPPPCRRLGRGRLPIGERGRAEGRRRPRRLGAGGSGSGRL